MNRQRTEKPYETLTDQESVENGETNLDTTEQDNSVYVVVNTGRSQHTGKNTYHTHTGHTHTHIFQCI